MPPTGKLFSGGSLNFKNFHSKEEFSSGCLDKQQRIAAHLKLPSAERCLQFFLSLSRWLFNWKIYYGKFSWKYADGKDFYEKQDNRWIWNIFSKQNKFFGGIINDEKFKYSLKVVKFYNFYIVLRQKLLKSL